MELQAEPGYNWVRPRSDVSTRTFKAKPKQVTVVYTEGPSGAGLCTRVCTDYGSVFLGLYIQRAACSCICHTGYLAYACEIIAGDVVLLSDDVFQGILLSSSLQLLLS